MTTLTHIHIHTHSPQVGMAGLRAENSVLRAMFLHAATADPKSGLGMAFSLDLVNLYAQ